MALTEHLQQIISCNHCGFCQVACPIFRVTGREDGVARGRVALLASLMDGKLPWSAQVEEPLFNCLLCGACTANCFPAIPTPDLILEARQEYLKNQGRKSLHRLLFDHLLPYPPRLRLTARLAASAQALKIKNLLDSLKLLRFLGPDFPETMDIPGQLPLQAFRDRIRPQTWRGRGTSLNVAYFVGCGQDITCPEAALDTLDILKTISRTVEVLPNCCCGLPAETYGDRPVARNMAERNLKLLSAKPYDLIVTDCSSCAAFLKKYPTLYPEDDPRHSVAVRQVSRVKDLVEVLSEHPPARSGRRADLVVTYHDPCHAVRGQKLKSQPREVIKALPGIEFREMNEADWCCGGAGSYALGHYQLARQVLERKVGNIRASQAQVVVTSCPACVMHLSFGCRRNTIPVKVIHLSQLVNRP